MKIQTFSIVAGSRACDGRCPFCVSRMTGFEELPKHIHHVNVRNLNKAIKLAELGGCTTTLITGKGEPTLYPNEVDLYLHRLRNTSIPFVELQTNALQIGRLARDGISSLHLSWLRCWYENGLDTIAISIVGVTQKENAQVYHEDYPPLARTVEFLHEKGFSVRLCLMMQKGMVDSESKLEEVINFCKTHEVEQLTARPIRTPTTLVSPPADDYFKYTAKHGLTDTEVNDITQHVIEEGTLLMRLMHGAEVYDYEGQNICLSDCLTVVPDNDNIRTLIFYANGRISYDWQHKGAVLLGGQRTS